MKTHMTKLMTLVLTIALTIGLAGCSEKEQFTVTGEQVGSLDENNSFNAHYKFVPENRKIALAMDVENHTGDDASFDAVWQYREAGAFHEIMRTETTVKSGENSLSFVLDSNKDLFRGEYMVEVYHGENLEAAYRFWILPEEKKADESIGIYQLSACSPLNESACFTDERCEKTYFLATEESTEETFVCEPVL